MGSITYFTREQFEQLPSSWQRVHTVDNYIGTYVSLESNYQIAGTFTRTLEILERIQRIALALFASLISFGLALLNETIQDYLWETTETITIALPDFGGLFPTTHCENSANASLYQELKNAANEAPPLDSSRVDQSLLHFLLKNDPETNTRRLYNLRLVDIDTLLGYMQVPLMELPRHFPREILPIDRFDILFGISPKIDGVYFPQHISDLLAEDREGTSSIDTVRTLLFYLQYNVVVNDQLVALVQQDLKESPVMLTGEGQIVPIPEEERGYPLEQKDLTILQRPDDAGTTLIAFGRLRLCEGLFIPVRLPENPSEALVSAMVMSGQHREEALLTDKEYSKEIRDLVDMEEFTKYLFTAEAGQTAVPLEVLHNPSDIAAAMKLYQKYQLPRVALNSQTETPPLLSKAIEWPLPTAIAVLYADTTSLVDNPELLAATLQNCLYEDAKPEICMLLLGFAMAHNIDIDPVLARYLNDRIAQDKHVVNVDGKWGWPVFGHWYQQAGRSRLSVAACPAKEGMEYLPFTRGYVEGTLEPTCARCPEMSAHEAILNYMNKALTGFPAENMMQQLQWFGFNTDGFLNFLITPDREGKLPLHRLSARGPLIFILSLLKKRGLHVKVFDQDCDGRVLLDVWAEKSLTSELLQELLDLAPEHLLAHPEKFDNFLKRAAEMRKLTFIVQFLRLAHERGVQLSPTQLTRVAPLFKDLNGKFFLPGEQVCSSSNLTILAHGDIELEDGLEVQVVKPEYQDPTVVKKLSLGNPDEPLLVYVHVEGEFFEWFHKILQHVQAHHFAYMQRVYKIPSWESGKQDAIAQPNYFFEEGLLALLVKKMHKKDQFIHDLYQYLLGEDPTTQLPRAFYLSRREDVLTLLKKAPLVLMGERLNKMNQEGDCLLAKWSQTLDPKLTQCLLDADPLGIKRKPEQLDAALRALQAVEVDSPAKMETVDILERAKARLGEEECINEVQLDRTGRPTLQDEAFGTPQAFLTSLATRVEEFRTEPAQLDRLLLKCLNGEQPEISPATPLTLFLLSQFAKAHALALDQRLERFMRLALVRTELEIDLEGQPALLVPHTQKVWHHVSGQTEMNFAYQLEGDQLRIVPITRQPLEDQNGLRLVYKVFRQEGLVNAIFRYLRPRTLPHHLASFFLGMADIAFNRKEMIDYFLQEGDEGNPRILNLERIADFAATLELAADGVLIPKDLLIGTLLICCKDRALEKIFLLARYAKRCAIELPEEVLNQVLFVFASTTSKVFSPSGEMWDSSLRTDLLRSPLEIPVGQAINVTRLRSRKEAMVVTLENLGSEETPVQFQVRSDMDLHEGLYALCCHITDKHRKMLQAAGFQGILAQIVDETDCPFVPLRSFLDFLIDTDPQSGLPRAVHLKYQEDVMLLLDNLSQEQADGLNQPNNNNDSLLSVWAAKGNRELIEKILATDRKSIIANPFVHIKALEIAIQAEAEEVVEALKAFAKSDPNLHKQS